MTDAIQKYTVRRGGREFRLEYEPGHEFPWFLYRSAHGGIIGSFRDPGSALGVAENEIEDTDPAMRNLEPETVVKTIEELGWECEHVPAEEKKETP